MVVVDGNKQAETLGELVDTFFDLLVTSDLPRPQTIPALDVLPGQRLSPHSEISEQRAVGSVAAGVAARPPSPLRRWRRRCCAPKPAEFYRQLALTLRVGEEIPLEDLLAHLESIGYEKRDPVEMVGEYSLRGGILDIFPAEASKPIRIELFGDQIESIRRFDVETQRSVLKIAETTLLPLAEYPKSREVLQAIAEEVDVAEPRRSVSGLGIAGAAGAAARGIAVFAGGASAGCIGRAGADRRGGRAGCGSGWRRAIGRIRARRRRIFIRWPELQRGAGAQGGAGAARAGADHGRAGGRAWPGARIAALAGVSRQHAGRDRARRAIWWSRLSRGLLRAIQRRTGAPGRHFPGVLGALPAGPRSGGCHAALSGRAGLRGGRGGQHSAGEGAGAARRRVPGRTHRGVRLRRSVRYLRAGREARPGEIATGGVHRRPGRSQARRLRGARRARRRPIPGHARDRAGREQGRLHAARIRRRTRSCMFR